jgi:hypothetical protein
MFPLVALLSITAASSADYYRDQGAPDPDQGAVNEDPGNRSRSKHKDRGHNRQRRSAGPQVLLDERDLLQVALGKRSRPGNRRA